MCSRTFAQGVNQMNASVTVRQAGQSKKMAEARLSFEERKTFLKWYLNSRTVWKYTDNGGVSMQQNLQHAQQLHAFVISLRRKVLFVMCTREDPRGLAQQQVLLLLLSCWNSSHARHRSLPNNVHVRQELAEQTYDAFLKQQDGNILTQDYYMH